MVNTRIGTKTLLCAVMASIACQSMAMSFQVPLTNATQYIPSARLTAASFAAVSMFLLCTRPAKTDFQARGNVREVLNVHHAVTDTRNYFTNLKDVYMDRFIGQKGKEAGLYANLATGVVSNRESCKPHGVLGTLHSKVPGHDETIKILTIVGSILAVNNQDQFLKYFGLMKKPAAQV